MGYKKRVAGAVNSVCTKTGDVTLTKEDIGLSMAIETIIVEHTFASNHADTSVVTVFTLPANARLLTINRNEYEMDSASFMRANFGTVADPICFGYLIETGFGSAQALPPVVSGKLFASSTPVNLTFTANSVGIQGYKMYFVVEYVQE